MYILIWVGLSTWYIYIYSSYNIVLLVVSTPLKKTTLSQLGLSFPKYGVTVIQTTSWIHLFAVICTYHMCLRTMLTQHIPYVLTHNAYAARSWQNPYATLRQPGFCLRQMFIWQGPFSKQFEQVFGVAQMFKSTLSSSGIIFPLQLQTVDLQINGHSRILNWRYLPYIRPIVQA